MMHNAGLQPFDLSEEGIKNPALYRKRRSRFVMGAFAFIVAIWFFSSHIPTISQRPVSLLDDAIPLPGEIPNIVHFVRQMNRRPDGSAERELHFEFRHYLAYYSAHYYLKPDQINIWSDVDQETIDSARLHGDRFTRAVLRLPNLHFRYVDMPNATATGYPITKYAHKSDFVRTRVMAEMGGQYFDDDAWVIRDLAPLRTTGYDNVFGKEWVGGICQAMWMSTANNSLMRAFERLQETEFNGDWTRASNILITNLAYDIRGFSHDRHALVLERNAFFPGQWNIEEDGLPVFYKVHEDADRVPEHPPPVKSVDELVSKYDYTRNWSWRRDWRTTYVIHGYSNAVRDEHANWLFDPYGGFTPEYILSRSSNIAVALYPALRHALDSGNLEDS